jgi:hypothetical protein
MGPNPSADHPFRCYLGERPRVSVSISPSGGKAKGAIAASGAEAGLVQPSPRRRGAQELTIAVKDFH